MWTVNYMIHNNLTEKGADGRLVPELAENWEASDDATEWVFDLRKGVEFHNGKTLDSEDVIASLNHHRGEDSTSAIKPLLELVEDFSATLASHGFSIKAAKDGKIDPTSPIGTGGYALERFEPGEAAKGKRNPNYWKEGRAHFDEVEIVAVHDTAARTNGLTTGDLDLIDRADLKTIARLKQAPGVEVKSLSGPLHYTFPMRTDTPPFDDINVRLALKHAVNREELVQKILYGYGTIGNDNPIGRSYFFHNPDLPQREYDPDKAKWYLQQSDLSSLKVSLSAADAAFSGAVDAAVLYQSHAAKAGIEIDVVREPNDGYWANVWMQKPWCACFWGGQPTTDTMLTIAYSAESSWNDTYWKHDRFNMLLKAARAELDEEKRREMYGEMQAIIRDEGATVIPMFANYVFAASDKLKHGDLASNLDVDGYKFAERWWFA
jgi:peptide/nickel transport system substrate-binding protein